MAETLAPRPTHMARLLCLLAFLAISMSALAETLRVAVAANVQFTFDELAAAFKKESGIEAKPVFGASGKFVAQILNGAPFDLLMSADMEYPEELAREGHAATPPKPYAYGGLVVWSMKELDLKNWPTLLASAQVTRIAIANPRTAPYGREAMKLFSHHRIDESVRDKLVYGASISQVNQYVLSGMVDAGFTAKSVVMSKEMQGKGKWVELTEKPFEPVAQGVIMLKYGQETHRESARRFYDFLFSKTARAIFLAHGYRLP